MKLVDGRLYVTADEVEVFDVTGPSAPAALGSLRVFGRHDVHRNRIFSATGGDRRDGSAIPGYVYSYSSAVPEVPWPAFESEVDLRVTPYVDQASKGSAHFILVGSHLGVDLLVLESSNPLCPEVHLLPLATGTARSLAVGGERLLLVGPDELAVLDVVEPLNPQELYHTGVFGDLLDVAAHDGLAVVLREDGTLLVLGLEQRIEPILLGTLAMPPGAGSIVMPSQNACYLTGDGLGLIVVDLADPRNPAMGPVLPLALPAESMATSNSVLALDHGNTVGLYDVSSPTDPALAATLELPRAREYRQILLDQNGHFLHLKDADSLWIYDVAVPGAPGVIGCIPLLSQWFAADEAGYYAAWTERATGRSAIRVYSPQCE